MLATSIDGVEHSGMLKGVMAPHRHIVKTRQMHLTRQARAKRGPRSMCSVSGQVWLAIRLDQRQGSWSAGDAGGRINRRIRTQRH